MVRRDGDDVLAVDRVEGHGAGGLGAQQVLHRLFSGGEIDAVMEGDHAAAVLQKAVDRIDKPFLANLVVRPVGNAVGEVDEDVVSVRVRRRQLQQRGGLLDLVGGDLQHGLGAVE